MVHWADVLAKELLERADTHVLATGITPSGPIHVGNMREVLTTEAVHRAVLDAGGDATLVYVADSYDPLRKVYPFLPASFEEHVGKPLSEVPSPSGSFESYAHEFLAPFLEALDTLGIHPVVKPAHELYGSGAYTESIVKALDAHPRIRAILEERSGRQLPKAWLPFNVRCPHCGTITNTKPLLYEFPEIEYSCTCGVQDRIDVRTPGAGKLPWRVDWPARWGFLGVTFEAFGKDHAASGGSWSTGMPIAKEVFGVEPPHHTVYEFIHIKGKGAMHSSTGVAISATEMLEMTPPEVLRFLIARYDPKRHIEFDPGLGLLDLVDEYDRWLQAHHDGETTPEMRDHERTLWLAQPDGRIPDGPMLDVPYRHLVTVAQIAGDVETTTGILQRGGYLGDDLPDDQRDALQARLHHVAAWLAGHAPDAVRFEVQQALPDEAVAAPGAPALGTLADIIEKGPWEAERIHNSVYEAAEAAGVKGGAIFQAAYLALLGKRRGPRFGHFAALLDREMVLGRLREAAEAARAA